VSLRALVASPLGFLVGLSLGALGGGGSILAVPALVHAAGQTPREATSTSLFLVAIAALVGLRVHARAGRVRVGTGVAFGLAGVPGSLVGSALNRRVDPDHLLLGFSVLVLVAAWRMLTGCPTCTSVGEQRVLRQPSAPSATRLGFGRVAGIAVAGAAVGLLTGLFGVGGGFVVVPALALLLELPMPAAIGTSLLVITVNALVSLAARFGSTTIDWAVAVPFVAAAILGVSAGARAADRLDPVHALRWFAAALVAVALYTGTSAMVG
jgi:hypothetical protein